MSKSDYDKSAAKLDRRVRKFEDHVVEEIQLTDTAAARKAVKRERFTELRFAAACLGLWGLLVVAGIIVRNPWPNDETRVLGIAWEMWARANLLVPYLNGEPELQPPFFFWLIHLGWSVFGVSDWWARLVAPLGALASLIVIQRLARLLWPEEREVARYAPLVLLGTLAFAFVVGVAVTDTWLLLFVLIAWWALVIHWRRRDMRAWMLAAVALGGATLTSGLIALVYVVPVALLAPAWARTPRPQWKYWYADLFKATAVGLILFGVWLTTVGIAEGAPQVARLLSYSWKGLPWDSFARQQPWWWYVAAVPLVFLPWSVLPLAWMRLWHIRREPLDSGFVFCLLWITLPVLLLSLLPVKQPQYLLPLLPAGALLASRLLMADALRSVHDDKGLAGLAIPLIVLGGVLMVLPRLPRVEFLPGMLWQQSPLVGLAIIGVGIAAGWLPLKDVRKRVFDLAALNILLVALVLLGMAHAFNSLYPLTEVGRVLAEVQARNQPVAHIGDYHGEFHFAGRLRTPLASRDPERIEAWIAANPDGVVVTYLDRWQPRGTTRVAPLWEAMFRDGRIQIISARELITAGAVQ